jgi:hypothetical protein
MTKRHYGKGGITERKNKNDEITGYQAQLRTPDSRRSFTAKTEREAQQWLRNAQKLAAQGKLGSSKAPTLSGYLTGTWLPMIQASVRFRTIASYKLNVQRIPAELGKRKLDELKPSRHADLHREPYARSI